MPRLLCSLLALLLCVPVRAEIVADDEWASEEDWEEADWDGEGWTEGAAVEPAEPAPTDPEPTAPAEAPPPAARDLPPPPVPLETAVKARRPRSTASEARIGRRALARANRTSTDDLLKLVPGVHVNRHAAEGKGPQLFLRGFDAAHGGDVELRVDGIPLNQGSHVHGHGYLDLGGVVPEAVRGIDVKKGSFHLDQGAFATAGTLDLHLGAPGRGVEAGTSFGSTVRGRGHAWAGDGDGTFVAGEAVTDAGFGARRAAERGGLLARAQHAALGGEGFVLGALSGARFDAPAPVRLDEVEAGARGLYGSADGRGAGDTGRVLLGAGWSGRVAGGRLKSVAWTGASTFSLQENVTGFLLDPEDGDRRLQEEARAFAGARVFYRRPLLAGLTLRTTAQVSGFALGQRQVGLDARSTPRAAGSERLVAEHDAGAGATLGWHGFGFLYVEGGARADALGFLARDVRTGKDAAAVRFALSPCALVRAHVTEDVAVFAAYGRGFRPPEARAFLPATDGGVEPDITATDSAELGARYDPSDRLAVGGAAFATYVDRETITDHVSGLTLAQNATARAGAEGYVNVRPLSFLGLGADATVVAARFVDSGDPVPGVPPVLARVFGDVTLPGGAFVSARWLALGARPLAFGARVEGALVLDARAGVELGPLVLDLQMDNVFDARWAQGAYAYASRPTRDSATSALPAVHTSPGSPRVLRLGVAARF